MQTTTPLWFAWLKRWARRVLLLVLVTVVYLDLQQMSSYSQVEETESAVLSRETNSSTGSQHESEKLVDITGQQHPSCQHNRVKHAQTGGVTRRGVFFAGLEGSGHHYAKAVVRSPSVRNLWVSVKTPRQWQCDMSNVWQDSNNIRQTAIQLWNQAFRGRSKNTVGVLPQQWSFPMCGLNSQNGRKTAKFVPHIDWMASTALQASVQFHVLFLYRDAVKSLLAGCVHRKFQPCDSYVTTLVNNMREMRRQFEVLESSCLVHPTWIRCLRYGAPTQNVGAFQAFFGSAMNWTSRAGDLERRPTLDEEMEIKRGKDVAGFEFEGVATGVSHNGSFVR